MTLQASAPVRVAAILLAALLLLTITPATPGSAQEGAADIVIDCEAPTPVTAGYASLAGKGITVTATDPAGSVTGFAVVEVTPATTPGGVTLETSEPSTAAGAPATATFRLSDDVPGLADASASYTVRITATSDTSAIGTCDVAVQVLPVRPIGEVTGAVADDADGRRHRSLFAPASGNAPGETVAVRGVITQRTQQLSPTGANPDRVFHGVFVQSLEPVAGETGPQYGDGNPQSSDGIFAFHSTFETLRTDEGGSYTPTVGDEVVLRAPVSEQFFATQLVNPFLVEVVRSGVDVTAEVTVAEANPPDDFREATVYWERLEGMQVTVPAGSQAVSGRDVFTGSQDGEVWVIRGDHPVAQRDDPYERRVFRDAHPLDNDGPTDLTEGPGDGNGYRILMASWGLKAAADDPRVLIAPARTFDTLTNAPTGGLQYTFGKYAVMVGEQPALERGADPSANNFPQVEYDRSEEWSTMVYNVENLYDFRDDPFSGCDLNTAGNLGCPTAESATVTVTPPFDYAPSTQEEYDEQRAEIAEQIVDVLNNPDVITVQEAEKQDVCEPIFDEADPAASRLECDLDPATAVEDRSGAPDTVEELAIEIFRRTDGEIRYAAAADAQHGRDVRGITSGFLYRADRVELVDDVSGDPVLGQDPEIDYPGPLAPWTAEAANPKAINATMPEGVELADGGRFPTQRYALSRATQVALFRIWTEGIGEGDAIERHIFSNHFSAGPPDRVEQRTEQANLNAAIAAAIIDEGGQVLVTGDFNVYPRPDDPFPSPETDPDREPSDQLGALYDVAGLTNLYDVILEEAPENAYSFIFQGQSQVLDQIFVDDATLTELEEVRYIHVNVDYPAEHPEGQPGRGASDHDPLFARFAFPEPEPRIQRLSGPTRIETAIAISRANFAPGVDVAYVATGYNFPDALAGGPAAGINRGPILLVGEAVSPALAEELRRLRPGRIDVLGGDAAVSDAIFGQLDALTDAPVNRISGTDRYGTAAAISAATFPDGADVVYVATGLNFPDALTGGVAAARDGGPLLLVERSLPESTRTELERLDVERIIVLGGSFAVPDEVLTQIEAATGVQPERLSGVDRWRTAAAIAATFDSEGGTVHIATGQRFPDALTGVPAAVMAGGPLLLSERTRLAPGLADALERLSPNRIVLLGGTGALGDELIPPLEALLADGGGATDD
jgi:uncharacterized protein